MKWYRQYHYQAFKQVLGIKEKVATKKLLELRLGKSFAEYLQIEQTNAIIKAASYMVGEANSERLENLKSFCR